MLPDTDAKVHARFSAGETGGQKTYQTDYLLDPQTIAPGATGTANARLFAGAKEVSVVGINFPLSMRRLQRGAGPQPFRPFDRLGLVLLPHQADVYVIDYFYRLVGNFGVAILIFATIIKIIFVPFANRSIAQ